MAATSSKSIDRFTPDSAKNDPNPPVYLIITPTPIGRAQYHREMTQLGARYWQLPAMVAQARQAIEALLPDNADTLIAMLDRSETLAAEPYLDEAELASLGDEETAARDARIAVIQAWNEAWADLVRVLQRSDPSFAGKLADNQFWVEAGPLVAAACFLVGGENTSVAIKRGMDGLVPQDVLSQLPQGHAEAIGGRAIGLMNVTEAERKNSKSPRQSSPAPASLKTSSSETAAPGTSSEPTTSATPS